MNTTTFNLLVALAWTDGVLTDEELGMLYRAGEALQLTHDQVDEIISQHKSASFVLPSLEEFGREERADCLYHLFEMMQVDGEMSESEMKFCLDTARKMMYPRQIFFPLLKSFHESNLEDGSEERRIYFRTLIMNN